MLPDVIYHIRDASRYDELAETKFDDYFQGLIEKNASYDFGNDGPKLRQKKMYIKYTSFFSLSSLLS